MNITFIVFGVAACMLTVPAMAEEDPRAKAGFYIDTYGLVDINNPLAARAYAIFNRVRQAAEDPIDLTPTLKVINSGGRPWAVALSDGYIILSRAALDICYEKVSAEIGDARLAFVLGHELAHLTAKDFWHRKIYLGLSGEQNDAALKKIRDAVLQEGSQGDWRDIVKRKELQADDAGFLYASLAGYRTDLIFSNSAKSKDFLSTWVKQTRTEQDDLHFDATERSAFLLNRFRNITAKVEYFMSGVRLAHFGRLEDARHFFEKFQSAFPSHEVLNNLGYVHLQLARKHMPEALRYHYWLPSFMDTVPWIVQKTRTMDAGMPPVAERHLQLAVKYLQKASTAHAKNLISRINLASAYLYLGDYHKARVQIEEARELSPANTLVREMRVIIVFEQEKDIDMWPMAVSTLEKLAHEKRPTVFFNLARLLEHRGRGKEAKKYWQKVVAMKGRLPLQVYQIACGKIVATSACEGGFSGANPKLPVKMRVETGTAIAAKSAQTFFKSWKRFHEEIGPLPVDILMAENGDFYLAVDGLVALSVVRKHAMDNTEKLLRQFGRPQSIDTVGENQLWSYGSSWAALVDSGHVRELWIRGE